MPGSMIVVVTGADGFIGRNLVLRMQELGRFEVRPLLRDSTEDDWQKAIVTADAVIHLAGTNRPREARDFGENLSVALRLAAAVQESGRAIPILYASSSKALSESAYGRSKRDAETALFDLAARTGSPVAVFRLPNVFGKWCRPNYNSAVATFCYNISRGLPIEIHDPDAHLSLVYIDDLVTEFIGHLDVKFETGFFSPSPIYHTTVGAVANWICKFQEDRDAHLVGNVGEGLTRALYATFISYLSAEDFAYGLTAHSDPRGMFAEMLRTEKSGQFSYFTAHPGVTRGGHYHHTKTEKFLVVQGQALFRFRHMLTGQTHEVRTSGASPVVVETIPGWTHDITNVGEDTLISMLWANEIFDRDRPDTITEKV